MSQPGHWTDDDDFEPASRMPLATASQSGAQQYVAPAPAAAKKGSKLRQPPETVERVLELVREQRSLTGIRDQLNAGGFTNSRGVVWPANNDHGVVKRIIKEAGLVEPPLTNEFDEDDEDDEDHEDEDAADGAAADIGDGAEGDEAQDEAEGVEAEGDEAADADAGGIDRTSARRTSSGPPPIYNERHLAKALQRAPAASAKPAASTKPAASAKVAKRGGTAAKKRASGGGASQPAPKRQAAASAAAASAAAASAGLEGFKLRNEATGRSSIIDPGLTFRALCGIARDFVYSAEPAEQRPSVLSFTYTDVEGDLVAVASDADLRMAVRLFRLDAAAPFLKLAVDETAAPTAAPATQKAAAAGRGGRAKQPAATQHKSAPPEPTVEELEGEEEDEAGDVVD